MSRGPARPGLFLRACRSDPGLQLLRAALDRALAGSADAAFASLFIDLRRGASADAVPALVEQLRTTGRLAADAEVTLHAPLATLRAVPSLADPALVGRLAIRDPAPAPRALAVLAGRVRLGVEIGPAPSLATTGLARTWQAVGVVHLGLRALHGEAADHASRLLDEAATLGFLRYEASNWALAGHEARWLRDARAGVALMALGPDAYGRWRAPDGWSWWRSPSPGAWRGAVARGEDGRGRRRRLPPRDRARERLIDGLHLAEGIDLAAIVADAGMPIGAWLDRAALERALAQGSLLLDPATARLRAVDLDRLDTLLASLLR